MDNCPEVETIVLRRKPSEGSLSKWLTFQRYDCLLNKNILEKWTRNCKKAIKYVIVIGRIWFKHFWSIHYFVELQKDLAHYTSETFKQSHSHCVTWESKIVLLPVLSFESMIYKHIFFYFMRVNSDHLFSS